METVLPSETSVTFYHSARRHIPEDCSIKQGRAEGGGLPGGSLQPSKPKLKKKQIL
jgi:hypothetical protein